jgi:hypothetical protein
MPLLGILIGLLVPRVLILGLFLLTPWFDGVFANILWPILGFIFLPTTLLWYSAVMNWFGGNWALLPLIGIVVAVLIDLAPAGGRRRRTVAV